MKLIKSSSRLLYSYLLLFSLGYLLQSCGDDPIPSPPQLVFNDLELVIDENPTNGYILGVMPASAERGTIEYTIMSQSAEGAMSIDANSGELVVANSIHFDFEVNPVLTAVVQASTDEVSDTANVRITLNDVDETSTSVNPDAFILVAVIANPNQNISLLPSPNLDLSEYDFEVDWGDGTKEEGNFDPHTYTTPGHYQIAITGNFPGFRLGNTGIHEIRQWGNQKWLSMHRAFEETDSIILPPSETPDLSLVNDFSYAFRKAGSISFEVAKWDMSSATDLSWMFYQAGNFHADISNWNVSQVNTMLNLFAGAQSFNQDIGGWNVSNVRDFRSMFSNTRFNQDLSQWDVSSGEQFGYMFANNTVFNRDIGNWNMSNAKRLTAMFLNNSSFNQDLSSWNISNATDLEQMFENASSFDQDLGSWDLSNMQTVQNMLNNSGLSTANYDALLNGWANASTTPSGLLLGASNMVYSADGKEGRNKLVNDKGWTVVGDQKQ